MLGCMERLDKITKSEMITQVLDREPECKARALIRDHFENGNDDIFFRSMMHGSDERRDLKLTNPFGRGSIDDK